MPLSHTNDIIFFSGRTSAYTGLTVSEKLAKFWRDNGVVGGIDAQMAFMAAQGFMQATFIDRLRAFFSVSGGLSIDNLTGTIDSLSGTIDGL